MLGGIKVTRHHAQLGFISLTVDVLLGCTVQLQVRTGLPVSGTSMLGSLALAPHSTGPLPPRACAHSDVKIDFHLLVVLQAFKASPWEAEAGGSL